MNLQTSTLSWAREKEKVKRCEENQHGGTEGSERREGGEVLWVLELRFFCHGEDYDTNCFPVIHKVHGGMQRSTHSLWGKVPMLEWVDAEEL